ncbi:phosphatase [Acetivibrio saccincola]|uniref:Phosphatase n=1 Tax=Acetivibrio saccincola TaxID=1677857 RepID=A0A2K9E7A9_9FIRM|nr:phosphatase [Acetivibrio saccincola]AUG58338.1 putative phosphatase YcdX [Acetivibrio saccincola]NLW27135.1 phosphatase [Acetivibrio saccincola]PQQ65360.1 phosphatase [Acetivibrio saccincola]PQQ68213.1 phosphatase [Acetivibrio saccincola]PQQ68419.1 phosphatase [Acetivibrio saccincola]
MKIVVDTHTHTLASGHAYSTIQEMAIEAAKNNIEAFAVTDHGPAMKGGPFLYHFGNLRVVPETINNVRIIKGAEANIIDFSGRLDIPDEYLRRLEFVVASFHDICIEPGSVEDHTNAVINVMKNPYVDAIAHPGNPVFQVDIPKVVSAAKEYNKFIEINNDSFVIRPGSDKNCKEFALECKKQGVKVVCGSDAHISFDVGRFERVSKLFEEIDMPEELVMNTSVSNFLEYFRFKKQRLQKR